MRNVMWRGKKSLNNWEDQRKAQGHHQRLRSVRPVSCDFEWEPPTLNPNKRLMLQEDRFTQIERENRYLLEKIVTTMKKKNDKDKDSKMNHTLNASFRRRQLQSIEVENARLLKRLQGKKSDYDAKKLKQEWKKQKQVIKNITFYPFVIRSNPNPKNRRRFHSKHEAHQSSRTKSFADEIQMVRARTFNGEGFVVTVRLDIIRLRIRGERRKTQEQKIIDIPRTEAMAFIQEQCQGKLQNVFDKLIYDEQENVLFLVGSGGDMALNTIKEKQSSMEEEKPVTSLGQSKDAATSV